MDRTVRAALLAAFIGFALVAGVLLFLQVPAFAAVSIGLVVGVLSGLLIWGAGRRADSFHPTDAVTPVEPGFPGPPEHVEDDPSDGEPAAPGVQDEPREPDLGAGRPDSGAEPDGDASDEPGSRERP